MMRKKRGLLILASAMFCLAMSFTALADTKISSVSLRVDSSIEAGTDDSDVDVTTSSSKYSVEDVDVTNIPKDGWEENDKPKVKVVLTAEDGYYFGSGFSKSDVSLTGDGGTVSSVSRSGTDTLNVTITLDALDDDVDSDDDLEVSDLEWDEDNGEASWEEAYDAKKYEVRLYRNGSLVTSVTTTDTSYDFAQYFTRSGTYTFKVRGVYNSSNKGSWEESDEFYVTSSEAEDIRENATTSGSYYGSGSTGPGTSSGNSTGPGASGNGGAWLWDKDAGRWWYCNSDRTYPVDQWQYIDNYWYFFDGSGYMVTGWVSWKGVWYYCSDSGAMLTSTTTPDGYWVDANGAWVQ